MVPGPSETEILSALAIGRPTDLVDAVTRSHLADGRCVGWRGKTPIGLDVVVDAELGEQVVPGLLSRRFGIEDFWQRWTRAECAAKLTGVPIVDWIKRHGLAVPAGVMESTTFRAHWLASGLVVSVAWRPPTTRALVPAPSLSTAEPVTACAQVLNRQLAQQAADE